METQKGKLVYMVYRALTYGLSPFLHLHLQWRRLRGLEHSLRWPERLGRPSLTRPPGPLLWFHAVSLGEGMAAIPVIKHCVRQRPDINILMTTTTASAFEVIKGRLPNRVIYQFAPLDTPAAMESFLGHWNPNAIVLMESELWPNLILGASRKGIVVALLNARVSMKSFNLWSETVAQSLILLMLSKFSLIIPLSTVEAIHFQLLQAPPFIINFAGDLKYVTGDIDVSEKTSAEIEDLQLQLANRKVWMAASLHEGEEEVILAVHKVLMQTYPDMVTIIVPRHPRQRKQIALALQKEGLEVVFRSREEKIMPSTNIYVADTLGELQSLYRLTPIAVIGGSFFPGLAGHNFSEAAAAGCAILTGHHIGHFSHMVSRMQHSNSLAVLQVSGKAELVEALNELFSNACALEARRTAAKQAFLALSNGIIEKLSLTPTAAVGGSLLPGLSGRNISEAAAAGCAVLTGQQVGHFSDMFLKTKQSNPMSILQVSGKAALAEALNELFSNPNALGARRLAAKEASLALSSGVVEKLESYRYPCFQKGTSGN